VSTLSNHDCLDQQLVYSLCIHIGLIPIENSASVLQISSLRMVLERSNDHDKHMEW
jgi:hypothetical protein